MPPIRVAAVQAASVAYDLPSSLTKLRNLVKDASSDGAHLAVFPEAFLSAYPRHLDFAIGARTAENRAWYTRYVESSVRIPDGAEGNDWLANQGEADLTEADDFWAFEQICRAARDSSIHISVGIIERSLVGATLWCTNILVSDRGVLLSKHRKLMPTAAERVVWAQSGAINEPTSGSDCPPTDNLAVVSTPFGKVGGLICWEHLMPLPRYALYQKGVQIWTAPTADGRPTWAPIMQTIAQEGRCFVVSANQYHGPPDFPSDYPASVARAGGAKDDVWCRGGSVIIGPLGDILAGPLWDTEGIICANIDLADITGAKLDFDATGHYSRSDIFQLTVKK